MRVFYLITILLPSVFSKYTLEGNTGDNKIQQDDDIKFNIHISPKYTPDEIFELNTIVKGNRDNVISLPSSVIVHSNGNKTVIDVHGVRAGNCKVHFNMSNSNITFNISNLDQFYLHVNVLRSKGLDVFNVIIGWIYFVAWSISFYPQIWMNFRTRSVVGLNFDFIVLNILGFAVYSAYNIGLFSIHYIQNEYHEKYPGSIIPVQTNDVVFSTMALFAATVTGIQCLIYERGGQRIAIWAWVFLAGSGVIIVVTAFLCAFTWPTSYFTWLNYLNIISYIKLAVTVVKYMPQAYLNFRRKSTVGWSIANVLLDITGGTLSLLQEVLIAYNSADFPAMVADPVKFGLGFVSIVFDLLFIFQHYVLYRHARRKTGMEKKPLLGSEPDIQIK